MGRVVSEPQSNLSPDYTFLSLNFISRISFSLTLSSSDSHNPGMSRPFPTSAVSNRLSEAVSEQMPQLLIQTLLELRRRGCG